MLCVTAFFMVVAKTRGRGRGWGVSFYFNFCRSILLYCYFRITGICPSFMVEEKIKIKKTKKPTEAIKALKGHPSSFFSKSDFVVLGFKIEVGFCERLSLSFRKIGVCFSK